MFYSYLTDDAGRVRTSTNLGVSAGNSAVIFDKFLFLGTNTYSSLPYAPPGRVGGLDVDAAQFAQNEAAARSFGPSIANEASSSFSVSAHAREFTAYTARFNDVVWVYAYEKAFAATGAGDDYVYLNGTGVSEVRAGSGADTVHGGRGSDRLYGDEGGDLLRGNEGDDKLFGGAGADTLSGGAGNDWLDGGTGIDVFEASSGDDAYVFDEAAERVTGELADGGTDTIWSTVSVDLAQNAFVENLRLQGAGDIDGAGNGLKNLITGNGGGNVIAGGAGNDQLWGKGGADTFVFSEMGAAHRDSIWDFGADDRIALDRAVFAGLDTDGDGRLDPTALSLTGKAVGASAQLVYNANTGILSYDADGAGAGAAQDIAFIGRKLAAFDAGNVVLSA